MNSLSEYEEFIYGLPQQFPAIVYSTLLVVRRGAGTALVRGEVIFSGGVRLVMSERLMLAAEYYRSSVTVTRSGAAAEKLYWYDLQPHPGDANPFQSLQEKGACFEKQTPQPLSLSTALWPDSLLQDRLSFTGSSQR